MKALGKPFGMTRLARTAALALALAGVLVGCEKQAGESVRAQARTVSVVTVAPREIQGGLIASGNLIPREDTAIISQLNGYRVAKVLVDVGSWVKAGQPLVQLDDTLLRAQLAQQTALAEQQRVDAERADAEAARVKGLDTEGILSQEQIDARRFAANAAHAQANAAVAAVNDVRARESLMTLRAPWAGLVYERNVRVGDMGAAAAATPWFRMARDGEIELAAEVAEDALSKLHIGDTARVTLADGAEAMGTIRLISPGVDTATKLGVVRIHLPVRPDIRAGGFARATFLGATRSALAVPETAVRYDANGASVMAVGPGDVLTRIVVTTGARGGGFVELLTGPPAGAQVVARAAAMFVPGDIVRPIPAQ
jgi:HlyD family secretion protein